MNGQLHVIKGFKVENKSITARKDSHVVGYGQSLCIYTLCNYAPFNDVFIYSEYGKTEYSNENF